MRRGRVGILSKVWDVLGPSSPEGVFDGGLLSIQRYRLAWRIMTLEKMRYSMKHFWIVAVLSPSRRHAGTVSVGDVLVHL